MNYKEILKSIGWPTEILVIDFETYYDQEYSLSKMSTVEFVTDKRFEFTGLGFAVLNDKEDGDIPPHFSLSGVPMTIQNLQKSYGQNFENVTVVIQNAKFDALILKEKFNIIPPYIIDTIDLAKHYDARMSHRLKDLAEKFGLKPKGKTVQFKGLHYGEMDKKTKAALVEYTKGDVEIEADLFKILLPILSNPMVELPLAKHTLQLYLRPNIKFDAVFAKELKEKMQQEMNLALNFTGLTKKELGGNISFVKALQDALPEGESIPMKQGKRKFIPALAKNDDGMKSLLTHSNKNVRLLAAGRLAIKSWPLHIKKVQNMENQAACKNGLLGMPLGYYSAHTGRWGGGEKINPQNFGGRGRGVETHKLIQQMRQLLTAPEGQSFYIADYAQIEARVLAWLAGQDDLIDGFKNGEDIYSNFATHLFKIPIRKPFESDPDPIAHYLKVRRGFGKDAILGCGYGMGTNTFFGNCRENPDLRPLFDSGEYTWDFIDKLIKTYRSKYSNITKFWHCVEKCFRWVIKYPHEVRKYCIHSLNEHTLTFWNYKGTVHLQLPSGRILYYHNARIAKGGNYSTIQYHWGHLWGGGITENIVQAVARDIMAEAILKLEAANFPVVLHIHDEVLVLSTLDENVSKLQQIIDIMCDNPEWAEGLPLAVEGELSPVYKK